MLYLVNLFCDFFIMKIAEGNNILFIMYAIPKK